MNDHASPALEATCRNLASGGGASLPWTWDARLGAALATFPGDQAAARRSAVEAHLGAGWDHSTIGTAPLAVQRLAARIGGVRPGQWIAASDAEQPAAAVAVWWPWSGGATISVRVFPVQTDTSQAGSDAFVAAFRGWFGV